MKFRLPKNLMTGQRWDLLTVLFVSLAGIVGILYAMIFAYPEVLPAPLQGRTPTPTLMPSTVPTARDAKAFPTFPPEWTAVFATRQAQLLSRTPTRPGSSLGSAASPTLSATRALTVSTTATLLLTPSATSSSTPTPQASATLTPADVSPTPTASPSESPTAPGQSEYPTYTPFPTDYPFTP